MLAVATICALPLTAGPIASSPDDATIYATIFRHTIRPQAKELLRNLPADELPFVIVRDSTLAACDTSGIGRGPCISELAFKWLNELLAGEEFQDPEFRDAVAPWLDELHAGNNHIVPEFRHTNAQRRSLVGLQVEGAIVVAADRIQEVQATSRDRTNGIAGFSRPYYTRNGHAIVFATYYCGNVCAYGWLFLLHSESGRWWVDSVKLIFMS